MKKYYINYGTGAGDKETIGTLEEAMRVADDGIAYTQADVTITDEDGNAVATRTWYGVEPTEDDREGDIITFGSFGFYGEWN